MNRSVHAAKACALHVQDTPEPSARATRRTRLPDMGGNLAADASTYAALEWGALCVMRIDGPDGAYSALQEGILRE